MRHEQLKVWGLPVVGLLLLAGCSTVPPGGVPPSASPAPSLPPSADAMGRPSLYTCNYAPESSGGFYKDDGPLALPAGLSLVPEPLPRAEILHRWANNPYTVLGQNFVPLKEVGTLKQQGVASWYGRKFHGQKTSSGEVYDMFQMTAAHPTLPIPSYARVTNLKNGRSVVVRINDRGPFLKGRVIDLSFLAACRLDYALQGSTEVEVTSLLPGAIEPAAASIAAMTPATGVEVQPLVTQPLIQATALPAAPQAVAPSIEAQAIAVASNGFYLQFGAFGLRSNAENLLAHLARELDEPQAAKLLIQQSGAMFRVRLGPFAQRSLAQLEAEKLIGQKSLAAMVVR